MPKYQVTGPDGSKFVVQAPEGATEAQVMTFAFSEFAKGMSPRDLSVARAKNDAFGDFLRQQAMQPREGESEAERNRRLYGGTPVPTGEGALRSFGQGGTFGAMDEVVAGMAAAAEPLARTVRGLPPAQTDFGQRYEQYLNRERARLGQFREEQPVVAAGAEIAGAIPTSIMLSPTSVPNTLAGRMLQGGAVAGAQGATYGALSGEGGAQDRAINAAITGGIAAPIGVAAEPIATGAGALVRQIMKSRALSGARGAMPPGLEGLSGPEFRMLTRPFVDDPQAAAAARATMQNMPPEGMLADVTPGYDVLLDQMIQRSGPAATTARTAIENRGSAAANALDQAFENTLGPLQGPTQGVRAQARGIAQATAPERQAAYQAAYSQPIDYASPQGRAIEGVLSRIPNDVKNQAIKAANEMMQMDGEVNQQIIARVADDGSVIFENMPNVQQLDYIKRALGELAEGTKDVRGIMSGAGARYAGVARDLRNAISDAVPEYGNALRVASDKIGLDQAVDLGQTVLQPSMTREKVAEAVQGMTDAERAQAGLSLRQWIDDEAAKVMAAASDTNTPMREVTKIFKTLSSRANQEKLEMLLGPGGSREIMNALDRVQRAVEQRAAVARGSQTFQRSFIDQQMNEVAGSGVMDALTSGQPVVAARNLVAQLSGNTPAVRQRAQDIAGQRMVEMLTQGGTQNIDALLRALAERGPRAIQAGENTQALARMLLRSPAAATGAAGAETGRAAFGLPTP